MYDYNELLNNLPIDQLASQGGETPADVENAVRNALPALRLGLGANAQDPAGEASILSALSDHDPSLVEGGVTCPASTPRTARRSHTTSSVTARTRSSASSVAWVAAMASFRSCSRSLPRWSWHGWLAS